MDDPQLNSKACDTLAGEEYRKWDRTDFRLLNRFDPFFVNLFGSTPFLFWFRIVTTREYRQRWSKASHGFHTKRQWQDLRG